MPIYSQSDSGDSEYQKLSLVSRKRLAAMFDIYLPYLLVELALVETNKTVRHQIIEEISTFKGRGAELGDRFLEKKLVSGIENRHLFIDSAKLYRPPSERFHRHFVPETP